MSESNHVKAPSVIPSRMEFFNKLSSEWWNKGLRERRYLFAVTKIIVSYIQQRLIKEKFVNNSLKSTSTPLENLHILDVGCGGGSISEPLVRQGASLVGIDVNSSLIEIAKQHAKKDISLTKLVYHLESIEEHSTNNTEKYDAVILSHVLIHVKYRDIFLNNCVNCLKPGGSIFIVSPNKTWTLWLYYIFIGERVLKIIPQGLNKWNSLVKISQVKEMLMQCGCLIKDVKGCHYSYITRTWNFKNHNLFHFMLHAVKK